MTKAGLFVAVVLAIFTILTTATVWYALRSKRLKESSWSSLVERLLPVNREALRTVAFDLVDENGNAWGKGSGLDDDTVWSLLGGIDGIRKLEANCAVLVDLAEYVQTWYPEAIKVAGDLRTHAREIEWHVSRLQAAESRGKLESQFAMYAQKAASTYFRMTQSLLALYKVAADTTTQRRLEAAI